MLTWLDFILLAIMIVSALLAMMRGFTREVLSIIAWATAAVAALLAYPRFQDWAREQIQPNWMADIILVLGVFIVVLIVVSYITIRISDVILDSRVGAIDRTLGFAFGLARGLVLVVIAYMFFVWLVPDDRQPQWVADARFKPLLQDTGEALIALLPEDPESTILNLRRQGEGDAVVPPDEAPDADDGDQSIDQLLEGG